MTITNPFAVEATPATALAVPAGPATPAPEPPPGGPRAFFMDVSPEQAEAWLAPDVNVSNRRVTPAVVRFYADAMTRREWAITGESIQFAGDVTADCRLLNGQHRLHAIVASGLGQHLLIVDGLDAETFAVLDTGRPRSFADVLSAAGEVDTAYVAAAARLAYQIENGLTTGTTGGGAGPRGRVSNLQLQRWVTEHPEFLDYAGEAFALRRAVPLKTSAGMVAFWRLAQIDANDAARFFEGVRTGANLEPRDARLALRGWLTRTGPNARGIAHLAIVYKAWNAWRADRSVVLLRWSGDGAYREAFPEPR